MRSFSHVPGVSAAVTIDGQLVWSGVSGWADVEARSPVTPESRFRLASVTKLYTATLALRLSEQRLLDLDADELDELKAHIADKLDLENDKIEALVEAGIDWLDATYDLIQSVRDLKELGPLL